MNERIKELLNSDNPDDIKLGVELLYLKDKSFFEKKKTFDVFYIPQKWHKYVRSMSFNEWGSQIAFHQIIDNYCKENNYWIYE